MGPPAASTRYEVRTAAIRAVATCHHALGLQFVAIGEAYCSLWSRGSSQDGTRVRVAALRRQRGTGH
ncbi:MAG: hypothetical protein AVDCRST_MAG66-2619 [uncultured Pseudonocardia sp.]|uniref:Uncharacterized protein n=1 Tax=uncultured Pseudonocardia sp. TaxID=211455 RepID=A0A6J4PNY1_9PSEU|nr:MAG: hypothetical protein AVDCRST_MAG66-2619 [uncultured Pseudonocardia sp.]